jgi:hypothetical protein
MAEIGKFVWNNTSANLSYSIDMKTRIVRIESIDQDGYDFLFRLNVGREITLYNNKGDVINMVIQNLSDINGGIEGQAIFR